MTNQVAATNPDTTDEADDHSFFDMFAEIGISIAGMRSEIKKINDRAEDGRRNLPRQITLFQESVNATTVDFLDFGGPQAGRKWEIRLLAVISATSAGLIAMATTFTTWYVGQRVTGNAAGLLPVSQARWQFPLVPSFKDLSADQITVLPNEHLMAGLTGIPAAPTQIMCIATINDIPLYVGRPVSST